MPWFSVPASFSKFRSLIPLHTTKLIESMILVGFIPMSKSNSSSKLLGLVSLRESSSTTKTMRQWYIEHKETYREICFTQSSMVCKSFKESYSISCILFRESLQPNTPKISVSTKCFKQLSSCNYLTLFVRSSSLYQAFFYVFVGRICCQRTKCEKYLTALNHILFGSIKNIPGQSHDKSDAIWVAIMSMRF